MPRWQDVKSAYQYKLTDQLNDDMIARRAWRAIGLPGTISNIYKVEKALNIQVDDTASLIDRVLGIFGHVRSVTPESITAEFSTDYASDKEIRDKIKAADTYVSYNTINVVLVRLRNTDDVVAYAVMLKDQLFDILDPPVYVTDYATNDLSTVIIRTSVDVIFRIFRPYCFDFKI